MIEKDIEQTLIVWLKESPVEDKFVGLILYKSWTENATTNISISYIPAFSVIFLAFSSLSTTGCTNTANNKYYTMINDY